MVDSAGDPGRPPIACEISYSLRYYPLSGAAARRVARAVFAMPAVLHLPGYAPQFWLWCLPFYVSSQRLSHAPRASLATACASPQIATASTPLPLSFLPTLSTSLP